MRALPRLRPGSNLLGWLRTLLHHRFINWTRRADRRGLPLDGHEPAAPAADEELAKPSWLDISDRDVRAAINHLPEGSATILRMKLVSRMSYREIARRLGVSCNTVGTRLPRARRRLRALLIAGMRAPLEPVTSLRPARKGLPLAVPARVVDAPEAIRASAGAGRP